MPRRSSESQLMRCKAFESPPDGEYLKNHNHLLMRFVLENTRKETVPFSVTELADLFKLQNGSVLSEKSIWMKIRKNCLNGHLIEGYTLRDAIKIAFLTSSPISTSFKDEIEKEAEIKLDTKNRIIRCESLSKFMLDFYKLEGDHEKVEWRDKTVRQRKREEKETPATWEELLADREKELKRAETAAMASGQAPSHLSSSLPVTAPPSFPIKRRLSTINAEDMDMGAPPSSRPLLSSNNRRVVKSEDVVQLKGYRQTGGSSESVTVKSETRPIKEEPADVVEKMDEDVEFIEVVDTLTLFNEDDDDEVFIV